MKLFRFFRKKILQPPKIAVVVSTWTGTHPDFLQSLLNSIKKYAPGLEYDLYLCANGEEYSPFSGAEIIFKDIFVRENTGYNLGAWDYAWRRLPQYNYFLFLQDDCFIKKDGWLFAFYEYFLCKERCGLVGEYLNRGWDRSWQDLIGKSENEGVSLTKRNRAIYYYNKIVNWGIDPGMKASHLTSVVHFTSKLVLEVVDGYRIASKYEDAVAAEICFSRSIQASGYELFQVRKKRHKIIGHSQWSS